MAPEVTRTRVPVAAGAWFVEFHGGGVLLGCAAKGEALDRSAMVELSIEEARRLSDAISAAAGYEYGSIQQARAGFRRLEAAAEDVKSAMEELLEGLYRR